MKKSLLVLLVSIALAACTGVTGNAMSDAQAPSFSATTTDGEDVSLSSVTDDSPAVIYFMASWCPKCAKNWKGINAAYPDFRDDVEFVAVSIDPTDTEDVLQNLSEEKDFLFDTVPGDKGVATEFGVQQQTTKLVVDENGTIVRKHVGVLSPKEWRDLFESVA